MNKYWLIYTEKLFNGFKAIGFNDPREIEIFKDIFKKDLVFIETLESSRKAKELDPKGLKEYYTEYIETLKKEGDTDIPSFEQYKKEIEEYEKLSDRKKVY